MQPKSRNFNDGDPIPEEFAFARVDPNKEYQSLVQLYMALGGGWS